MTPLLNLYDRHVDLRLAAFEQRATVEFHLDVRDDAAAFNQRAFGRLEVSDCILKQRAGRQLLYHRWQRGADSSLTNYDSSPELLHSRREDFAGGSASTIGK